MTLRRALIPLLLLVLCVAAVTQAASGSSTEEKYFKLHIPAYQVFGQGGSCNHKWSNSSGVCTTKVTNGPNALSFQGHLATVHFTWCHECWSKEIPAHPRSVKIANSDSSTYLIGKVAGNALLIVGGRVDGKTVLPDDHEVARTGHPGGPLKLLVDEKGDYLLNGKQNTNFVVEGYLKLEG